MRPLRLPRNVAERGLENRAAWVFGEGTVDNDGGAPIDTPTLNLASS